MEDELRNLIIKTVEVVRDVATELNDYSRNHASSEEDPSKVNHDYQTKVLPQLLQWRKLNRLFREKLDEKNVKIEHLNRKLANSKDECDNIAFEEACLKHEVVFAKRKLSPTKNRNESDSQVLSESNGTSATSFDIDEVGQMSHAQRLQLVDREEAKRRNLKERLVEATAETDEIALVCEDNAALLNRLKPSIQQLLDKVDLGDTPRKD